MMRSLSGTASLVLLPALFAACGRAPELAPPSKAEQGAILQAVQDYAGRHGGPSGLVLRDDAAGTDRTLRVTHVGKRVKPIRYRLSVVEGEGEDAQGERYPIRFYVLQSGPVFIVDTAHIPARGVPAFAP